MVDDGHLAEEPYQVEVVEGAQEVGLAEDSVFLAFVADVGVRQPVDDDAGALNAAILDIPRTGDVSVRGGVGVVAEFGFVAVDVVRDDHLVGTDASEDQEPLEIGAVTVPVGPLCGEQHVVDARQTEIELFGRFVEVGGGDGAFERDFEEVAAGDRRGAGGQDERDPADDGVC